MKKVTITTYSFAELSEKAKAKAIDQFRDINTDHEWWDYVYSDFGEICNTIGIEVDLKHTYFNGFSIQGQGATFSADIDLSKLIEGIKNKTWANHAPNLEQDNNFTPSPCPVDKRVLKLIEQGVIDLSCGIEHNSRYYSSKVDFSSNYTYNECIDYNNIEAELKKLEDWLKDIAGELDSLLFNLLEKEYDYMTSEEAIIETIEANDYQFLESGKQYF